MTQSLINSKNAIQVSIIIPTYNESQNILKILKSIGEILTPDVSAQAIVVDDNSPDGTGKVVENHIKNVKRVADYTIDIIHRTAKRGLSSAILKGIQYAKSDTIIVMDSDFSHPPQIIPKMIEALKHHCDIVIASRYVKGGNIIGWPLKRKLMSKMATAIAKKGLGVKTTDPMSGFFAFKRPILTGLKFDAIGYKMLLEILVKTKGVTIKEIPYSFTDRKFGSSKVSFSVACDYAKSVWKLYRYGKHLRKPDKRPSVRFFSKAARFFTVGASGLAVNYLASMLFTVGFLDFWYLYANLIGIIVSITSNFFLNKIWTFEDKDIALKKTLIQYIKFAGFSSSGALIQLFLVFSLIENYQMLYPLALVIGVTAGAMGNFILNKKWTFKEKIWD